jgi:hypothetical protein
VGWDIFGGERIEHVSDDLSFFRKTKTLAVYKQAHSTCEHSFFEEECVKANHGDENEEPHCTPVYGQ